MKPSALDLCLFWKVEHGKICGLQGVLVDDTLGTGTEKFMKQEDLHSKRFETKGYGHTWRTSSHSRGVVTRQLDHTL